MRIFLMILAFLLAAPAFAQREVTRLQCDGKYSNFLTGYRDVDTKGSYVEIQKAGVKVISLIGFDGTYDVYSSNEARICFVHPEDKLVQGCLNRFSGQLQLHQQSKEPRAGDYGGFDQLWEGNCTSARPLF